MPVTLRAACCVTTRCVEAAKPSDDAWEAARAVLRGSVLPVPVDIERQDSLCVCTLPALAPVRAIGLEEAGHPLCVCQAHETLLGGIGGLLVWASNAGHVVASNHSPRLPRQPTLHLDRSITVSLAKDNSRS